MVRRIVALLLVGAWQLQAVVPPHIHAGMTAAELVEHGQRRHVHLSHGPHADHGHSSAHHEHAGRAHDHSHSHPHKTPPGAHGFAAAPAGHDGDAIYLDAGSLANLSSTSSQLVPQGVVTFVESAIGTVASLERHTSAPPRYGGQVPTFLSTSRLLL